MNWSEEYLSVRSPSLPVAINSYTANSKIIRWI